MLAEKDLKEINQLGYIVDIPFSLAVSLFNEYFSGIDLLSLLKNVGQLLDEYANKPVYKRIEIYNSPEPFFEITYRSNDYNDLTHGLMLIRTFYIRDDLLIAKHTYFSLPEHARHQKIGTKILATFLDRYLNMGVKQIHLFAGLKDGGAVWAKTGFNALYKHEMADILHVAEETFPGTPLLQLIKGIFDSYYKKEPNGKSFPIHRWADIDEMDQILKQCNWHGWIDLTNKEELRIFKANVGR